MSLDIKSNIFLVFEKNLIIINDFQEIALTEYSTKSMKLSSFFLCKYTIAVELRVEIEWKLHESNISLYTHNFYILIYLNMENKNVSNLLLDLVVAK